MPFIMFLYIIGSEIYIIIIIIIIIDKIGRKCFPCFVILFVNLRIHIVF